MQAAAQDTGSQLEVTESEVTCSDTESEAVATATSMGEESECSNPDRMKLRRKLDELQEKKGHMEQLLGELQTLRRYRAANGESVYWFVCRVSRLHPD